MILISIPFTVKDNDIVIKSLDISCPRSKVKKSIEKLLKEELSYFRLEDDIIICSHPDKLKSYILELEPTVEYNEKKKGGYLSVPSNEELLKYGY